jgi:hypothetical protein
MPNRFLREAALYIVKIVATVLKLVGKRLRFWLGKSIFSFFSKWFHFHLRIQLPASSPFDFYHVMELNISIQRGIPGGLGI